MRTIIVDPSRCLQCGDCMIACHDEHYDNDWSPIAAPQGDAACWIRIDQEEVASGNLVKVNRVPVMCQQCENAACVAAAKDGAVYRRDDGIVIIDPVKAKGQKQVVKACPYDAVCWNEALQLPQKCTMCAHLLDEGWKEPRCVTACPADALRFVDMAELTEENLYAPLEQLKPMRNDAPLVKYVKLPKPFVGGDVVDLKTGEAVQNVKVTAIHQVTGATAFGYSDAFGGFRVERLEPGFYTLMFEVPGYAFKKLTDVDLRHALNVDEVELTALA